MNVLLPAKGLSRHIRFVKSFSARSCLFTSKFAVWKKYDNSKSRALKVWSNTMIFQGQSNIPRLAGTQKECCQVVTFLKYFNHSAATTYF